MLGFTKKSGVTSEVPVYIPRSGLADAGRMFKDALNAAILGVRANGDLAQAIVAAKDGSYQLAPLAARDPQGAWTGVVVDGRFLDPEVSSVAAKKLHDAVQAIVGRDTVFNLSGHSTPTVSLYGPDAWKGESLAAISTRTGSPYKGDPLTLVGREDAEMVGDTLQQAVEQASMAARDGFNATQAVLLGADGKYYISRVDSAQGGTPFIRLRDVAGAKPESSSVQALVGTKDIILFANEPIETSLNRISVG